MHIPTYVCYCFLEQLKVLDMQSLFDIWLRVEPSSDLFGRCTKTNIVTDPVATLIVVKISTNSIAHPTSY